MRAIVVKIPVMGECICYQGKTLFDSIYIVRHPEKVNRDDERALLKKHESIESYKERLGSRIRTMTDEKIKILKKMNIEIIDKNTKTYNPKRKLIYRTDDAWYAVIALKPKTKEDTHKRQEPNKENKVVSKTVATKSIKDSKETKDKNIMKMSKLGISKKGKQPLIGGISPPNSSDRISIESLTYDKKSPITTTPSTPLSTATPSTPLSTATPTTPLSTATPTNSPSITNTPFTAPSTTTPTNSLHNDLIKFVTRNLELRKDLRNIYINDMFIRYKNNIEKVPVSETKGGGTLRRKTSKVTAKKTKENILKQRGGDIIPIDIELKIATEWKHDFSPKSGFKPDLYKQMMSIYPQKAMTEENYVMEIFNKRMTDKQLYKLHKVSFDIDQIPFLQEKVGETVFSRLRKEYSPDMTLGNRITERVLGTDFKRKYTFARIMDPIHTKESTDSKEILVALNPTDTRETKDLKEILLNDIDAINEIANNFFNQLGFQIKFRIEPIIDNYNQKVTGVNIKSNDQSVSIKTGYFTINKIVSYLQDKNADEFTENMNNIVQMIYGNDVNKQRFLPLLFKSLGDHLQIHLAQRASEKHNPFFITTKDRIAIATCFEIDTPCIFQSKINFNNTLDTFDEIVVNNEVDKPDEYDSSPTYLYLGNILDSKELDDNDVRFLNVEFLEDIMKLLNNKLTKRNINDVQQSIGDLVNKNIEIKLLKDFLTGENIALNELKNHINDRVKARRVGGVHQYLHMCRLLQCVMQIVNKPGLLNHTILTSRVLTANYGIMGSNSPLTRLYISMNIEKFKKNSLSNITISKSNVDDYLERIDQSLDINTNDKLTEFREQIDKWDSTPFAIVCRNTIELLRESFIDDTIFKYIYNSLAKTEITGVITKINQFFKAYKVFIEQKNEFIEMNEQIKPISIKGRKLLERFEKFWILLITLNNVFKPWFDMENKMNEINQKSVRF
jgi:hypothetical protein